jgi:hypothetical protein
MKTYNFPIRYIPTKLTRKDKQKQLTMLLKSKKHLFWQLNQEKYINMDIQKQKNRRIN